MQVGERFSTQSGGRCDPRNPVLASFWPHKRAHFRTSALNTAQRSEGRVSCGATFRGIDLGNLIRLPNRELKGRVASGASLLDACRPDWAEKVDLRKLGGMENDVIQQVFGDVEEAGRVFGVPDIREGLQAAFEGRRHEPALPWPCRRTARRPGRHGVSLHQALR
jgi:hypothetical protein